MDKAYLEKNIAHCSKRIEMYKIQLKKAEATGEDAEALQESMDGYVEKREELSEQLSEINS